MQSGCVDVRVVAGFQCVTRPLSTLNWWTFHGLATAASAVSTSTTFVSID